MLEFEWVIHQQHVGDTRAPISVHAGVLVSFTPAAHRQAYQTKSPCKAGAITVVGQWKRKPGSTN
eukprot:1143566-Pelagomonas_calceolata.AAC.1